jgi:hypothetical protein
VASKVFVPAKTSATTTGGGKVFVPASQAHSTVTPTSKVFVAAPGHKSGGSHGILGLVENFGSDVKDTITGIAPGLVHVAEHPIGSAKAIGKSYQYTYGDSWNVSLLDLLRSHTARHKFGLTLKKIYAHPLGPLLDLSAAFTGGAGLVARGGETAATLGLLSKEAELANLRQLEHATLRSPRQLVKEGRLKDLPADMQGKIPDSIESQRPYSRNPGTRALQQALHETLLKLPAEFPMLGETARYGREFGKLERSKAFALQNQIARYDKTVRHLSHEEQTAANLLARGVTPEQMHEFLSGKAASRSRTADEAKARLSVLDRQYNKLLERTAVKLGYLKENGKLDKVQMAEVRRRGTITGQARKQQSMRGVVSGDKARVQASVRAEVLQQAEDELLRAMEKNPDAPGMDKLRAVIAERERLRSTLQNEDVLFGGATPDAAALGIVPGVSVPHNMLRLLEDPKVRNLVANPSKKVLAAHAEMVRLSELARDVLIERGALTADTARNRLYLTSRIVSGGRFEPVPLAPEKITVGRRVTPNDRFNIGKVVEVDREAETAKVHFVSPEGKHADVTFPFDQLHDPNQHHLVGGKTPDEIDAELAAAGHPGLAYVPDRMIADYVANPALARKGGGVGVPKTVVRENRAVLLTTGRLALGEDTLGPQFLRTVKWALHSDLHDALEKAAVRAPEGVLPAGWRYLRRKNEHIPYTEQANAQFERNLEQMVPKAQEPQGLGDFVTSNADEAATDPAGNRLIVPQKFATQVAGEFTRSNSVIRAFIEKPLTVWRALILGYRPAFLVNNVVGNHLLLAVRLLGPAGLAGYVDAVRTIKGHATAEKLLAEGERAGVIDKAFINTYFPDFAGAGTFGRSQMPQFLGARSRKVAEKAKVGILPTTQTASETFLRRAAAAAFIRKNPELRRIYKAMPKQTRSWRAAAEHGFENDPRLVREVSDQVNSALGDYLGLSQFERTTIRNVVPFYAWYRAILTITLKLPLHSPGRALLLAKVGQVGAEIDTADVPSYLRGAIPLGQTPTGLNRVLSTTGLNPYQTVVQLARGRCCARPAVTQGRQHGRSAPS